MGRAYGAAVIALLASGCYASHEAGDDDAGSLCSPPSFECIAPDPDPCGPPRAVDPVLGADTCDWTCRAGSRRLVRTAPPADCRPFHEPSMGIRLVAGSLTRVPLPDGRCLWVADSVTPATGPEVSNVGFLPDLTAPLGTCPTRATVLGGSLASAVVLEDGGGASYIVAIGGGWLEHGETRVSYRLFHLDPMGGFGVTEDGTGIARWDATTQKIVVPSPRALLWGPTLDFGDAVLPAYDARSFTYLWGCPPPIHDLVEDCVLARRDAAGTTTEYFGPTGWGATTVPLVRMFAAGPWLSSVTTSTTGFAHVYAAGFGSDLEEDTAIYPYGPWAPGARVAHCAIPSADPHAYCAGPVVHEELGDPTRSDDVAVTYGLGTTDPAGGMRIGASPDDYWTRLAWAHLP